jgi:hypothetical protein
MSCTNRAILIYGLTAALDPVEFDWSTQSLLGSSQSANLTSGFSEATGTKAVMNCGLRAFQAYEPTLSPFKYSSLWFGQQSSDCMWFPGNSYKGNTLFGLENDGTSTQFDVENFSDALRVP